MIHMFGKYLCRGGPPWPPLSCACTTKSWNAHICPGGPPWPPNLAHTPQYYGTRYMYGRPPVAALVSRIHHEIISRIHHEIMGRTGRVATGGRPYGRGLPGVTADVICRLVVIGPRNVPGLRRRRCRRSMCWLLRQRNARCSNSSGGLRSRGRLHRHFHRKGYVP